MMAKRSIWLGVGMMALLGCLMVPHTALADEDLVSQILEENVYEEDSPEEPPARRRRPKEFASRKVSHPLTDLPDESDEVETSYYFPDHADLRFPIGGQVTVLCHLRNIGDGPLNVTYIMGSLNNAIDNSHFIQNFTFQGIQLQLPPGFEGTFEYPFKLHPQLDAIEYQVAHTIFYENDKESFSTTFFNKTVELIHAPQELDVSTMLRTVVGIGLLLVVVWLFKSSEKPRVQSTGTTKGRSETWDDIDLIGRGAGGKGKRQGKSKKT